MAYDDSDLKTDIAKWTQQSLEQGWMTKQLASALLEKPADSANALFENIEARPLVVAFMGGTGVGKSSLINKLAGQSIARTGVERPTSREVTLYHHQSVSLRLLEEKFPLQQIQIAQHTNADNEKIIWIDMPDFDSTEKKNKNIVMQWLPYVDILIYVVSPERYRDNKAWQLLLSQGANHAWLFVMNQWDRGETSQYEDFKKQLAKAGFDNPLIFKTICVDQTEDDLAALQHAIINLAQENTVVQLQQRGLQQQKQKLKQKLQDCRQVLGDHDGIAKLINYQEQNWQHTGNILEQGFEWPIKQASISYAKTKIASKREKIKLWDDWAQTRFNDYLDKLILYVDQKGLPSHPLRKQLAAIRTEAGKTINTQTELGCRKSLVNPGNVLQRAILKLARICEFLLPFIAMAVVGYMVFHGYYNSSVREVDFLGVNFAVHSLLLILLSWLIPFFIRKKMQPSLEKAALKGLNNGLDIAKTTIDIQIKQAINDFNEQHQQMIQAVDQFIDMADQQVENSVAKPKSENLQRMLVDREVT